MTIRRGHLGDRQTLMGQGERWSDCREGSPGQGHQPGPARSQRRPVGDLSAAPGSGLQASALTENAFLPFQAPGWRAQYRSPGTLAPANLPALHAAARPLLYTCLSHAAKSHPVRLEPCLCNVPRPDLAFQRTVPAVALTNPRGQKGRGGQEGGWERASSPPADAAKKVTRLPSPRMPPGVAVTCSP